MSKKESKISIIIIHYNTPGYLEGCIKAILGQSYENIEILFIDNNSPDPSGLEFVREKYGKHPQVRIIANRDNLGYALAANQGIRIAIEGKEPQEAITNKDDIPLPKGFKPADFVVITNPDILYTKTYFETAVARIKKDKKIAALTGKIYKYDFENDKKTKIIDTVGLFAYKNRRIMDDGQGLLDEGQFDEEGETFGVSGACPLYRREALEDAKVLGEYLDEDFFMYKEDVDLSWRFLLFGWKSYYDPKSVAYHGRGTGIIKRFHNKDILQHRTKLSKFQRHYSFKNQHLMQVKNEMWGTFFSDFFPIMIRKILTPLYITLREPFLWKAWWGYMKQLPSALRKRRKIMKKTKISTKEMSKWFGKQSKYLR
jgi:GT2 family glycosyltransferase